MLHPFKRFSESQYAMMFWPLLILTAFLMVVMNIVSRPLTTSQAPLGIISFELAGSPIKTAAILETWATSTRLAAAFSLGLDFLFIVVYSTTLSLGCIWTGVVMHRKRFPFASLSAPLAWLQWAAAVLDGIENWGLLRILMNGPAAPWPEIAFWCAAAKFGLILLGICFCISGLALSLRYLPPGKSL